MKEKTQRKRGSFSHGEMEKHFIIPIMFGHPKAKMRVFVVRIQLR